jgi:hypothetical protein
MDQQWNRVLMERNDSAIGSHMVLMPTDYRPNPNALRGRKEEMTMVQQRMSLSDDPNRCQPTPYHPPYEAKPTDPWIFSGSKHELVTFPIQF